MRISKEKKDKIAEQILALLYSKAPQPLFTSIIAKDLARDEEFIKQLLIGLEEKKLLISIKKNPKGKAYKRRSRWRLSDVAYQAYQNRQ
ncbi:hypothetical protein COU57_00720 [Candidatus Pacearchaeota archaeon CG10_big_fil_rev_8_21_14_0_10_32_14]|nr:MAG: hypothetical protein COU57_00720 [Candidatus Pacearchaeota archaeon CG10_big_fil_rev_8_21_14_0_10_32_14]